MESSGERRGIATGLNKSGRRRVYSPARPPSKTGGAMNASALVTIVFVSFTLSLHAADGPAQLDTSAPKKILDWNDKRWWEAMKQTDPNRKSPNLSLGKSDFVVKGPLVETFRPGPRPAGDQSLIEKMRRWPIVSLFVPQPMPWPSGGGKYFAWGERDVPWSVLGDRPIPGPQGALVSVSR